MNNEGEIGFTSRLVAHYKGLLSVTESKELISEMNDRIVFMKLEMDYNKNIEVNYVDADDW